MLVFSYLQSIKNMEQSNLLENSKALQQGAEHIDSLWGIWLQRYRTRKQLHTLLLGDPKRLHHDLGLSTEVALAEIKKPFWRR